MAILRQKLLKKMNNCLTFLQASQDRVNKALEFHLSQQASPFAKADEQRLLILKQANAYSVNNGGKRLRPALVYATANCLDDTIDHYDLDLIASAVECIHSYSLVHDDLPAMDLSHQPDGTG